MVRKRRAAPQIILEILELAKGGSKRTNIMNECNMSFSQATSYLDILSDAGWIKEDSEGNWFTTEKGRNVCTTCQKCKEIFNEMKDESK